MDAHFVLQATAVNAIALAHDTIGRHLELGHQKQADAFVAGRRVGQAGQHQVHDVGGQVVFACADENLLPSDAVGAIGLGFGLGTQESQVGAAMRLGQAHGAGPLAAGELGQVQGFLLGRAVRMQGLVSAVRQTGVHGPGLVGRVEHFVETLVHHKWQALPAIFGVATQGGPTTGDVLLVRGFEAVWGFHRVGLAVELAALRVARDVDGENHLGGELAALFQHRVDGVGIGVGVLGQSLEFFADVEQLMQDKLHVTKGRVVDGHGNS